MSYSTSSPMNQLVPTSPSSPTSYSQEDQSDSSELLNKYRSHLEKQKKLLERHQNFLKRRKEEKEQNSSPNPSPTVSNVKAVSSNNDVDPSVNGKQATSNNRSFSDLHHAEITESGTGIDNGVDHSLFSGEYTKQKITQQRDPNVDSHALHLSEKGQHFLHEREKKLLEMRKTREKLLESEQYNTPKLSEKTRWIVEKKRRSSQKKRVIEDELMEKELQRRQSLFLESERKYAMENPGTPKITAQAARMVRDGSVTDRLFEMASKLREKKRIFAEAQIREEVFNDEKTMESSSRSVPVYIDLLKREEKRRQQIKEKMDKLAEKEKKLHKPKINAVSLEIAARLPSSSKERLLAPKPQKVEPEQIEDPNCSFRPYICQRSREIEAEKEATARRVERLLLKERRRKEKIEALRSFHEEKQLEECTFAPRTSSSSFLQRSRRDRALPFSERALQWQQIRESKLIEKRKNIEAKEMENCTFHPKIVPQNEDPNISSLTTYQEDSSPSQPPSGFEEFVNRQKEARRRKEELQNGPFITGENWANRVTKPKAFKLGAERKIHKPVPSKSHVYSPAEIQRAVHKEIEKISTSFEESPSVRRYEDDFDEELNHQELSFEPDDNERNESQEDIQNDQFPIEHIPPQGLFSAGGTLSILQGLNFVYKT